MAKQKTIPIYNCRILYLIPEAVICIVLLTSCVRTLSDDEREVINENLADILYAKNVDTHVESVTDYIWNAVDEYVDRMHDDIQNDIDEYNAVTSWFGTGFDVCTWFGSSLPEQYAKSYYKFVDYVNDHRDELFNDIERFGNIIKRNPSLLNNFFSSSSVISLEPFESVEGLPATLASEQFEQYRDLELNKSNQSKCAELVMGSLKGPRYSPLAVLCVLVVRIERLKHPKPVYAVYKENDIFEDDGWEVGY